MLASDIPLRLPIPFANSGNKNTIPTASQITIAAGRASLTDGYPPLCLTPVAAGGVPPFGQDTNGILYEISAWSRWQGAGGAVPWDSAFSTAIGGYPAGAVVASTATVGLKWLSLVDNNVTNPDAAGAGWVTASGGRLINVQTFIASGTYTPTPGTRFARVTAVGGGGAGGGSTATAAGGVSVGSPGCGGATGIGQYTITGTVAVTVGAGGTGSAGANGTSGGTSSFGALMTCPGGPAGSAVAAIAANTVATTATNSGLPTGANILSSAGGAGTLSMGFTSGAGAGGAGGASNLGPGAPGQSVNSVGVAAINAGAGGGGCVNIGAGTSAIAGGAGFRGIVIVEEYS